MRLVGTKDAVRLRAEVSAPWQPRAKFNGAQALSFFQKTRRAENLA